jgi:hypothetical protein
VHLAAFPWFWQRRLYVKHESASQFSREFQSQLIPTGFRKIGDWIAKFSESSAMVVCGSVVPKWLAKPLILLLISNYLAEKFPGYLVYRALVERALRKKPTYPMKRLCLWLWVLCLVPMHLFAWTDGELLIWMDTDRGHVLKPIAQKFEDRFGVKATIESPEKITDSFPLAAQVAKGPDIVATENRPSTKLYPEI